MDPISDMFIRIKNAQNAGHKTAQLPYSRMKHEIARALERTGFVGHAERKGKRVKKYLDVDLIGGKEKPGFMGVKLLSTPGRRVYVSYKEVRSAAHGGVVLLTTSKGIMSGEEARREKVGGQLLAEIW
ncbi:MAG: 30S ribosomal protein S8 [Candidatus Sungbacteria bacterium]|nr:30S ribosomal protein S8 [Candidatus Sungbacteria bacterium]